MTEFSLGKQDLKYLSYEEIQSLTELDSVKLYEGIFSAYLNIKTKSLDEYQSTFENFILNMISNLKKEDVEEIAKYILVYKLNSLNTKSRFLTYNFFLTPRNIFISLSYFMMVNDYELREEQKQNASYFVALIVFYSIKENCFGKDRQYTLGDFIRTMNKTGDIKSIRDCIDKNLFTLIVNSGDHKLRKQYMKLNLSL